MIFFHLYIKHNGTIDEFATEFKFILNACDENHLINHNQKRHGLNKGGVYYLIECFGAIFEIISNIGEVFEPKFADFNYYIVVSKERNINVSDELFESFVMYLKNLLSENKLEVSTRKF